MRLARMMLLLALTTLICLAGSVAAEARDRRMLETSSPQEVVNGMANKAVRGVANVATGWGEFPKQIYVTYQEDGILKSIAVGPLKGVGMTLVRTFSGAAEFLTFFMAYPGFYDPYFEPAYVWEKE